MMWRFDWGGLVFPRLTSKLLPGGIYNRVLTRAEKLGKKKNRNGARSMPYIYVYIGTRPVDDTAASESNFFAPLAKIKRTLRHSIVEGENIFPNDNTRLCGKRSRGLVTATVPFYPITRLPNNRNILPLPLTRITITMQSRIALRHF